MAKRRGWSNLSHNERDALLSRKHDGALVEDLAAEVGMKATTLDRRLREWNALYLVPVSDPGGDPEYDALFRYIKDTPRSIVEIADKFDRSPKAVQGWLSDMAAAGYVITETDRAVKADTHNRPVLPRALPETLADRSGQEVVFAVASDLHAGSTHSQPTNRKRFLDIAINEYGAKHILDPGDLTTGIFGYRGHEQDIIPSARPASRKDAAWATQQQIWLADAYTPQYDGVQYYVLGGNHDWWHVMNSGIDAVSQTCKQRPDMHFLGYDVADIPLTDKVDIRLWHPTGGVPYSKSYRLQKGVEAMAFQQLQDAVVTGENPKMRFLIAGHLHIEVSMHSGPYMAFHPGCFEGQTNYLKRKGLYPQVGGVVVKARIADNGLIQRAEYVFIPSTEIHHDWLNWPQPPARDEIGVGTDVEPLFQAQLGG